MLDRKLFVRPFKRSAIPKPNTEYYKLELPPGPLDLEIGCGVGMHPLSYVQSHPERKLIAIEHTAEKYAKFLKSIQKQAPLSNLIPVHANAISWITHMLAPSQVSRYFILYPNPNPKVGDAQKRWHCMPFNEVLLETMAPQGELTLATNCQFYAEEARLYYRDYWGLELLSYERFINGEQNIVARTHFELKYLNDQQACFNLVFRKS